MSIFQSEINQNYLNSYQFISNCRYEYSVKILKKHITVVENKHSTLYTQKSYRIVTAGSRLCH